MYSSWYEYLYYYWWYHQQACYQQHDLEKGTEPMEIESVEFQVLQEIKQELYSISQKMDAIKCKLQL